jgi:UDP-N-acetylglucosamine 1-carboxyvinyltransferase
MSSKLLIKGGQPLRGKTEIKGSKNAATKMMVASLLTEEPCVIENVPLSDDIDITAELCQKIGSEISFEEHSCKMQTKTIAVSLVPELSRKNRIPVLALGPLLHRNGVAEVPVLGGCPIGHRPINFHLEALNRMGVRVERREKSYYAKANSINGAEIELPYPSVGATENIILTAVLAKGDTQIQNAAIEPEIMNLIDMLVLMGAKISCDLGSRKIKISGVGKLSGAKIKVMPDRNEIVSLAVLTLATFGDVVMKGVDQFFNFTSTGCNNYLEIFLQKIKEMGGNFEANSEGLRFWGQSPYKPVSVQTAPHPSFMTDWQQPFAVLLTQAEGESMIHETVYEDRFGYVKDLQKMGADITVTDECLGSQCRFHGQTFNHSARVNGPTKLRGSEIEMKDIRAGMSHLIAALTAEGESVITGVEHLDRGYERIDERLKGLGANIERV